MNWIDIVITTLISVLIVTFVGEPIKRFITGEFSESKRIKKDRKMENQQQQDIDLILNLLSQNKKYLTIVQIKQKLFKDQDYATYEYINNCLEILSIKGRVKNLGFGGARLETDAWIKIK